ncbi:MAG: hypothetical protein ABIL50_05970 [candidate division WOR-3 bacterium]
MSWMTIYSQGFEGGFPVDWYIGNGGSTITWEVVIYGSNPFEPPGFGDYYAICNANSGIYPFFDTLFSPKVYTSGSYDSLKIEYNYAFKKYGSTDLGKVILRYFDGTSWSPWIDEKIYTSTQKGKDSIKLPPYDSIQVAFVYISNEWSFWFSLDDFSVKGGKTYDYDISALGIVEPQNRGIYFKGNIIYPWVVIRNLGLNDVGTWIILKFYLGSDLVYADSTYTISYSGNTDTLSMGMYYADTVGEFRAVLRVNPLMDSLDENDSLSITFKVMPRPVKDITVRFSNNAPLIDGNFSTYEWADAISVDISNYAGKGSSPTDTATSKAYVKHDGSFVYMAIQTPDTIYNPLDVLNIVINDNANSSWDNGEGENALYPSPGMWWATRRIYGSSFGNWIYPRRDRNTFFAYGRGIVEVKIPFGLVDLKGDPSHIKTFVGGTFYLGMYYMDGGNGGILAWWPQDVDTNLYYNAGGLYKSHITLERPSGWRDLGIAGLLSPKTVETGYSCEVSHPCDIRFVIYDNNSEIIRPCTVGVKILEYPTLNLIYSWDTTITLYSLAYDTLGFTWNPYSSGYYKVIIELSDDQSRKNNYYEVIFGVSRVFLAPYVENFEGEFFLPLGWNREGDGWVLGNNFLNPNIAPAYGVSGYKFAEFTTYTTLSGDSSVLISPKIISPPDAVLTFWWWNGPTFSGRGNYDVLKVYYKTQSTPWTLLAWFYGDVYNWRNQIVPLPVLAGDTIQLKFVAISDYGDTDISLDDIGVIRNPLYVSESGKNLQGFKVFKGGVMLHKGEYYEIYDARGRVVFRGFVENDRVLRLAKGAYFVKVRGGIFKVLIG